MIIGHQKQWQFLINSFQKNKLSHAYLFSGPESVGKKTLAIEFAKFINCKSKKNNQACQNCRICKDIEKGIFPDLIIVQSETEIKIKQIRETEEYLSLYPSLSFFKIAIINRAHKMTTEAQNSFLKTLEEPKGNAIFILISEYPEMLLPTILSRVQRIKFNQVEDNYIKEYLRNKKVPQEKIEEIMKFSSGKPGRAMNFLNDYKKVKEIKNRIKEIKNMAQKDFIYRFQYVKNLIDYSENLKDILEIWLRYYRKNLLEQIQFSNKSEIKKIKKNIEKIFEIQLLLSTTNINSKLALEILMLDL